MEAESVGPETEKGGSRQEKDEVAVGWALGGAVRWRSALSLRGRGGDGETSLAL